MSRPAKKIHRLDLFDLVVQLLKAFQVPGQGGGVAGDVDDAAGAHGGQDGGDLGGQALAGRVHGDDIGADAVLGQLPGHGAGVAAEELRVGHAVAAGILLGVLDGLGHQLRADHAPGVPGQAQGDGADAAVQVQHRLPPGELGEVQGGGVQPLGLGPVDLEEGGHRQAEGQAAQRLLQPVPAPECAVVLAQDHVGVLGVPVEHHPRQGGDGLPEGIHQLPLPGQLAPVDHHAAQGLPRPVGPDVQVPHQALARGLVVGGNLVFLHPPDKGPPQAGHRLRLKEAILHGQHLVAPGPVVAHQRPILAGGHGELHLVPIAQGVLRPQHRGHGEGQPAQPGQSVLHPLTLGPQLLGVGHVAILTAAAAGAQGTVRLHPIRRGGQALHPPAPGHVFLYLLQPDPPALPPDHVRDKHHPALQPRHPQSLGGVAGDVQGADSVFLPNLHRVFLRRFLSLL